MEKIKNFFFEDTGATAVEYGLLIAAIAAVIVLAVNTVGGKVLAAFESINTNMK